MKRCKFCDIEYDPVLDAVGIVRHCSNRNYQPHEWEDRVEENSVQRLLRIREYVNRLFEAPNVGRQHYGLSVDDAKFLLDQHDFQATEHEAFATAMSKVKMEVEKVLPSP